MNVAIFYFSGSGNTKIVAELWQNSIKKLGFAAEIFKIEEISITKFDFSKYDMLGFGHPIHGFNCPKIMEDFCKKIPVQNRKINAFSFMVSGENLVINNSSNQRIKRFLKRRNINIISEYHYLMPYNMIFRHTEERAFKMLETLKAIIPLDAEDLLVNGLNNKLKKIKLLGWFVALVRIEQVFAPINGRFFKIDLNKCIKCMKCVNNCPVNNIEFLDGKFKFKNNCVLCTRCSFNCPKDAFSIGLLNNWRVNKPYSFKRPEIEEVDKHKKYCKKSYKKYFENCEKRLEIHKNS